MTMHTDGYEQNPCQPTIAVSSGSRKMSSWCVATHENKKINSRRGEAKRGSKKMHFHLLYYTIIKTVESRRPLQLSEGHFYSVN